MKTTKPTPPTQVVSVRLPTELIDRMRQITEATGIPASRMILDGAKYQVELVAKRNGVEVGRYAN
jgi:hypothetical protein